MRFLGRIEQVIIQDVEGLSVCSLLDMIVLFRNAVHEQFLTLFATAKYQSILLDYNKQSPSQIMS